MRDRFYFCRKMVIFDHFYAKILIHSLFLEIFANFVGKYLKKLQKIFKVRDCVWKWLFQNFWKSQRLCIKIFQHEKFYFFSKKAYFLVKLLKIKHFVLFSPMAKFKLGLSPSYYQFRAKNWLDNLAKGENSTSLDKVERNPAKAGMGQISDLWSVNRDQRSRNSTSLDKVERNPAKAGMGQISDLRSVTRDLRSRNSTSLDKVEKIRPFGRKLVEFRLYEPDHRATGAKW